MYLLNKKNIYDLPIHDSDLLNFSILQNDEGVTELRLRIAFYAEEVHQLEKPILELLGTNNEADLLISNCVWINLNGYYTVTNRDLFDFVEFLQESSVLERHGTKTSNNHIKITFISGSTLECIYETIGLVACKK